MNEKSIFCGIFSIGTGGEDEVGWISSFVVRADADASEEGNCRLCH
jgi:hypothetical protein